MLKSESVRPNSNPNVSNSQKKSEDGSASVAASKSKEIKQSCSNTPKDISDTGSEETDLSTSHVDFSSWISRFCGLRGNELLCEIDEDYIRDDFNLYGLQEQVQFYGYALDMILDNDYAGGFFGEEPTEIELDIAAELLYGLIHARYIITSDGLSVMHEKYKEVEFGRCPRVFCGGQPCLPVGTSDIPGDDCMKIYCPKCEELYLPRFKYQRSMDGSCFGTTFPHLYMMAYPCSKPTSTAQTYTPRVFGFKLHRSLRKLSEFDFSRPVMARPNKSEDFLLSGDDLTSSFQAPYSHSRLIRDRRESYRGKLPRSRKEQLPSQPKLPAELKDAVDRMMFLKTDSDIYMKYHVYALLTQEPSSIEILTDLNDEEARAYMNYYAGRVN